MSPIHHTKTQPTPSTHQIRHILKAVVRHRLSRPLAGESVAAGFPSPAEEYLEKSLDLNEHLVPHPEATFFVRVSGDSMTGAGIYHDDLLIVDRSQKPRSGNVIIACLDGEFTVKRLRKTPTGMELVPENPEYSAIVLTPDSDFEVWGVVRHVIHAV